MNYTKIKDLDVTPLYFTYPTLAGGGGGPDSTHPARLRRLQKTKNPGLHGVKSLDILSPTYLHVILSEGCLDNFTLGVWKFGETLFRVFDIKYNFSYH